MQVFRAAEYRRMPWKNGGGETREILVSPPGATLDSLDWRVSLATVASDGPFSVFPSVQRTLCVIRGEGIRLQVGDAPPSTLLVNSEPHTFDGDAAASATLINGSIVDLNVMSRRGRWRHTVRRLQFSDDVQLEAGAQPLIVFCQRGQVLCVAGDDSANLGIEDCAVLDQGAPKIGLHTVGPSEILIIELYQEARAA